MGTKAPHDKERTLVYQEPERNQFFQVQYCLEGYHFQINACPCLLLYEKHFKPACLGLAVCLLQDTNEMYDM